MHRSIPDRFEELLATPRISPDEGDILGGSLEGTPIRAFRFGSGPIAISLLAGCHADEPVGPRLLRHLVAYLFRLEATDPWLTDYQWWIVPHINPDGERRNARWAEDDASAYDIGRYLEGVIRELPGDDVEFGFPRVPSDRGARPENRAVFDWWRTCAGPFALHASLHGTGFAAGPWFLIEPEWRDRCETLKRRCLERVATLGYVPHDVERHGEKGFVRLERGFCTRPDSRSMYKHFMDLGDSTTAALFRPSSMEIMRSLGGDPLTLVSEMPHFITPGVGETLGPPDPVLERWRERIAGWKAEVSKSGDVAAITEQASEMGLVSMPVRDQMELQWTLVLAGLDLVAEGR
jgi:hypothetical protein